MMTRFGKMVLSRKGQAAYELLILFFFLTLGFTVWLMFISSAQQNAEYERREFHVRDFGLRLQDEIYTVALMPEGFERSIDLPPHLYGTSYELNITGWERKYLTVSTEDHHHNFIIPNITGSFNEGETNTLKSRQGYVCVNEGC